MKSIPQYQPEIRFKYIWDVAMQMYSGWVGFGTTTEKFEKKISEITRAKHAISTTSGTTAIILALESLDLKKGSTILFPSYTFLAGANAARFMGYKVKLVDIKEDTLCMNPDLIKITKNVSCVMFVNHNGYVGEDVRKIKDICDKHSIKMIEDSSQCVGIQGAGMTGDVGIFSFSVPKLVTTGQGGILFTNNTEIAKKALQLRDHGDNWRHNKLHTHLGVNFKFNDISAAYGLSQLNILDKLLNKRGDIFLEYEKKIPLYIWAIDYRNSWMVCYRTKEAEGIINALKCHNIHATQYYKPISWNEIYKTKEKFPVAEMIYKELLYLPSSLSLKPSEINKITSLIIKIEKS